ALAVLRRPDLPGNVVTRAQVEAPDLAGRNVDVVGPCQVGAVRGAQEAEPVLQDLENAVAVDVLALLGLGLEDFEDDVLFAGAGQSFKAQGFGKAYEFVSRLLLEFGKVHGLLHTPG